MESASDLPDIDDPATPTLALSSTYLRFPAPAANSRVSHWVESISATTMSNRSEASEESGLSGSTYEFIDTDEESRDGNTESIASTDFGRPDDVESVADTEESGDEEDNAMSLGPELPGNNDAVEAAFDTPTIGRSSAVLIDDIDKPITESIEFEEPLDLGAEAVSVKHTVSDYDEEKTAEVLKDIKWKKPPKRLMVTICQTMTGQGLSTREPLRILYVGSHSAKQDIIHKIASSVTASVNNGKRAQRLRDASSQIYNVVPVSDFGSERTPEIELMHSSGYQIKVEDCISAETLKFEDTPEKPDVIKLTLEDNFAYHSVPEEDDFTVEPSWELPHVAIFYCSHNDGVEARKSRTVARKFMARHNIPSIVISHKQIFDRGQCMSLDHHSIHMCLESRDPTGRGNIVHQRLPIDLASFLNIDARQMNRNLAYITGLHDTTDSAIQVAAADLKNSENLSDLKESTRTPGWAKQVRNAVSQLVPAGVPLWRVALSLGVILLSFYAAVFTEMTDLHIYRAPSEASISVNRKVMSAVPVLSTTSTIVTSITPSTITATSVAVSTSTRTVTVTQSLTPGPNSLSVVPAVELGKLSQVAQVAQNLVKGTNKSAICSAEVLGDREILIRIPSATKFSWFTKDSMFVNITRGNVSVDTERLYSSDEGIVLLLPKKEAHGILNISIITTKKPRVNEIFQVDFGTSAFQSWQNMVNRVMTSLMPEDGGLVEPKVFAQMRKQAEHIAEEILAQSHSTLAHLSEVSRVAIEEATAASSSLGDITKSMSLEAAKGSAILTKEIRLRLAEAEKAFTQNLKSFQHLREPLDDGILRAQIQSKLLWLKLQGKNKEHQEYERRAFEAVRKRAENARKSGKTGSKETKKARKASKKAALKEARAIQKGKKAGK